MVVDTHQGDDSFEELKKVMMEGNDMGLHGISKKTATEICQIEQAAAKRAGLSYVEEEFMIMNIRKMALNEAAQWLSVGDMDRAVGAMRVYDLTR